MHYSIRTDRHYFTARDNSTLEIVTNDRQRTTRAMKLTNAFFYTEFTHDTLRRVRDGRPPIADLADNAAAVALIEAAYAMSPLGGGRPPAMARSVLVVTRAGCAWAGWVGSSRRSAGASTITS